MAKYVVTAKKFRQTKRVTENGETRRVDTFFKFGDVVEMSPDDADRLLRSGGLVPEGTDPNSVKVGARLPDSTALTPEPTLTTPEAPGALSGQTADEGLREGTEPSPDAIQAHQDSLDAAAKAREEFNEANGGAPAQPQAPTGDQSTGDTPDDGYEELKYPQLQNLAKSRNLNAGGSSEDLIARLREQDQQG